MHVAPVCCVSNYWKLKSFISTVMMEVAHYTFPVTLTGCYQVLNISFLALSFILVFILIVRYGILVIFCKMLWHHSLTAFIMMNRASGHHECHITAFWPIKWSTSSFTTQQQSNVTHWCIIHTKLMAMTSTWKSAAFCLQTNE